MKNNRSKLILLLSSLVFIFAACGTGEEQHTILETPYERSEFLMGTYVTLRIYDEGKEEVLEEYPKIDI